MQTIEADIAITVDSKAIAPEVQNPPGADEFYPFPGFVATARRPWQMHYSPTPEHRAALEVWARNGRMARLRMLADRGGDREHWRRKMRYQIAEDKARRDAAKEASNG